LARGFRLIGIFRHTAVPILLFFKDKLVLRLFLRVHVSKTHVVDPQLKVLSVLHDSHLVALHVEREGEGPLKLLPVRNEHAIAEDTPLA